MTAFDRLDELLDGPMDVHVKMDVASVCGWACEITVVISNPDDRAARSHVVYGVHATAEDALCRTLDELERWLSEDPVSHRHPWADDPPAGYGEPPGWEE